MKNILFILSFAAFQLELPGQISPTVSMDVKFRIDPIDTSAKISPFFICHMETALTEKDQTAMINFSVSKILKSTSVGDSVENFQTVSLQPTFSTGTSINNCKNIKPGDFRIPAGSFSDNDWGKENDGIYFRKKGKGATSGNIFIDDEKRIVLSVDTALVADPKGKKFTTRCIYNFLQPQEASPSFVENWNFNPASGSFVKTVKYFGYYTRIDKDGFGSYYKSVFCIANQNHSVSGTNVLLKKNVICDVALHQPEIQLSFDTTRENYTGQDAVNYLRTSDGNTNETERAEMLSALFSFALNHPDHVFPASNGVVDSLHPYHSSDEVNAHFMHVDSVMVMDEANPWNEILKLVPNEKTLDDVYAIRFYEDWYYDPGNFEMKKVVRGVGIILLDENPVTGEPFLKDAGIFIKTN